MDTDSMEYLDDEYYDYYNEDDEMGTSRNLDGGGSKSNKNSMNKMRTSFGLNSSVTLSQAALANSSKFKSQITSMPMGLRASGNNKKNTQQQTAFLKAGTKIHHEDEDVLQDDSKTDLNNRTRNKSQIDNDDFDENSEDELKEGMYVSNSQSQLQKPLSFGLSEDMVYSSHKQPVKHFILNHNNQLYVTADDKQIHFWSIQTGLRKKVMHLPDFLKTHSCVSAIAFSHKFRSMDMSSIRLVNFAQFYDAESKLITAGIDGVFIFDVHYHGKYDPQQAAQIDPEGRSIRMTLEGMPIWAKGMKIDEENNMIVTWDHLNLTFHDLRGPEHKLLNSYKNLLQINSADHMSDTNQNITDVLVSKEYKYFVTATSLGQMMVWKHQKVKKMIHLYTGHFRDIGALAKHPSGDESMFLSVSLDGSVKIWSLDKFQMLYEFGFPYKATMCRFALSSKKVFIVQGSKILMNDLFLNAVPFTLPSEVEIKYIKASHRYIPIYEGSDQKMIQQFQLVMCEDNTVFVQDIETQRIQSTIFPPPTAQQTIAIFHSHKLNRLLVLLITGSICIYQFEKETALLERIQQPNQLRDSEGKGTGKQKIMCTALIKCYKRQHHIVPFDQDIFNERVHLNAVQNYVKDGLEDQEYFAFKMEQIYARITVSRAPVRNIHYVPTKQIFITICEELIVKIWGIDQREKKINIFYQMQIYRPIKYLVNIMNDYVLFAFESGDFEIFEVQASFGLVRQMTLDPKRQFVQQQQVRVNHLEAEKSKEHDSPLTGVDYHEGLNLLVTSCQEGIIKIWRMPYKIMIKEVKFPSRVDSVCFKKGWETPEQVLIQQQLKPKLETESDYDDQESKSEVKEEQLPPINGDIIVAHEKRVSCIKYETYWDQKEQLLLGNLEVKEIPRTEISEQLFQQMMLKENEIRGVNSNNNTITTSALKVQGGTAPGSPKNVKFKDQKRDTVTSGFKKFPELAGKTDKSHEMKMALEKPKSPMTLKALELFDKIDRQKEEQSKIRDANNPIKQDYLETLKKREEQNHNEPKISENEMLFMLHQAHQYGAQERNQEAHEEIKKALKNPNQYIALPPLKSFNEAKKKTLLTQTTRFVSFPMASQTSPSSFNLKHQMQKLTRRDITSDRITANIMKFNSPTQQRDFANLRLGPLPNMPRFHSQQPFQADEQLYTESMPNSQLQQNTSQNNALFTSQPTHRLLQEDDRSLVLLEMPSHQQISQSYPDSPNPIEENDMTQRISKKSMLKIGNNYTFIDKTRTNKHQKVKTLNNSPINYRSIYKLDETQIGVNLQNHVNKQQLMNNQRMRSFLFPSTQETSLIGNSYQEMSLLDNSQSVEMALRISEENPTLQEVSRTRDRPDFQLLTKQQQQYLLRKTNLKNVSVNGPSSPQSNWIGSTTDGGSAVGDLGISQNNSGVNISNQKNPFKSKTNSLKDNIERIKRGSNFKPQQLQQDKKKL
ncbi:UNKNOWN [Stylonychia lemnae]|uniref:Uncharacterized protein n=1 Tax=Stylonychia lemnae TaxID=5949 RepID=A0A078ARJ5_STYLE|nr:UNKNOWN [Stylonychia lemnae]|eukprot:CDW84829.1 UNKNOWN [Stylonychia lemnae]